MNPFADISDPAILRALVQDGVKCEWCWGTGDRYYETECDDCNGTGHTPLPNADLDALAACWCEGWKYWPDVDDRHWQKPPERACSYHHTCPAYTTDSAAAMRLAEKYALNLIVWRMEGDKVTEWRAIQSALVHIEPSCKATNANPCHAITEAALIAALTAAMLTETREAQSGPAAGTEAQKPEGPDLE